MALSPPQGLNQSLQFPKSIPNTPKNHLGHDFTQKSSVEAWGKVEVERKKNIL